MDDKQTSNNASDQLGPGFGERHKKLIVFVIIIFAIGGPLVFAALTVLGIFN